ncbi:MAG TPA: YaiO family outer membrane beta-barrel protein [Bacteroidales bacterium]|nr:YaiO family outer membrane beta-barrel protein [Bacteroidales bacterium]
MKRYACHYLISILFLGFFRIVPLIAQVNTDPETEFQRIRTIAFSGDYKTAATEARKLVNMYPSYGDARILLGRILAWQKDYRNAAAVIDTLLMTEPGNQDALSARRDISLWSKDNTPVSTDIRAGYFFDTFREPYSRYWQVFSAGAGHRFKPGPASAGINIGNLIAGDSQTIKTTEIQLEAEAYPHLSDKNYAYISYAFSPGSYFPKHKAAFELWQVMNSGWAMSAGLNYYHFDRDFFIANLAVEKYVSNYWLALKGFVYFKDNGPATSFYLNARRYLNDKDYIQVTLGTGTAPDEPFDIQEHLMRLSANSLRLAYNKQLTSKITLRLNAGYSREEYRADTWRNRFEGGINFTYAVNMK